MTLGASRRGVVALVLVLALASACTDKDDSAEPTPTTTTSRRASTPSSTVVSTEEQAVLDAYQGYWRAILAANNPPDERNPMLQQFATGEALDSVFKAAQANRLEGKALRPPENSKAEHRAEIVSMSESEATVRDCAIDDILVVKIDSGEVLNDKVATQLRTATLRHEGGAWKVAYTKLEERWDGVAGCAAVT